MASFLYFPVVVYLTHMKEIFPNFPNDLKRFNIDLLLTDGTGKLQDKTKNVWDRCDQSRPLSMRQKSHVQRVYCNFSWRMLIMVPTKPTVFITLRVYTAVTVKYPAYMWFRERSTRVTITNVAGATLTLSCVLYTNTTRSLEIQKYSSYMKILVTHGNAFRSVLPQEKNKLNY